MRWLTSILLLCLSVHGAFAQSTSLKISTWHLADVKFESTVDLAEKSAQGIRRARPDILLLQDVPDLAFCQQLVERLGTEEYTLSVYSDFLSDSKNDPIQLAIISRYNSVSTGKQTWRQSSTLAPRSSGFIFAAFPLENSTLKVYSTYLEKSETASESSGLNVQLSMAVREANAKQFREHVENNGTGPLVIGGNFNTNPGNPAFISEGTFDTLESAGFTSVFERMTDTKGIADLYRSRFPGLDNQSFWARGISFNGNFGIVESKVSPHSLVSCDVTLPSPIISNPPAAPEIPTLAEIEPAVPVAEIPHRNSIVEPLAIAPEKEIVAAEPVPASPPPIEELANNQKWEALLTITWWKANPHAILWALGGSLIVGVLVAGLLSFRQEKRETKHEILPAKFSVNPDSNAVITCPACEVSMIVPARIFSEQPGNHRHLSTSEISLPMFDACCTNGNEHTWMTRALHAEQKAEKAEAVVKKGMIPHMAQWMKDSFLRRVLFQRAELQKNQHVSTEQVAQLQERLSKINDSLKSKLDQYEGRISELEKENFAKDELNRELLKAKIIATEASRKAQSMKPSGPKDESETKSYPFPSQNYPPAT